MLQIRVCPACGSEFQPHVEICIDCGAETEARVEAPPPLAPRAAPGRIPGRPAAPVSPLPDERQATPIREGSYDYIQGLVSFLVQSGVPARLAQPAADCAGGSCGTSYQAVVAPKDLERALAVDADYYRRVVPEGDAAVRYETDACPACGTPLPGEPDECPDCGLVLGG